MVDPILTWLSEQHGFFAYAALAALAGLEYVVPPIPGDTVSLFGVFLAVSAGFDPFLVYLALMAGSVLGGLGAYAFGRWIAGSPTREPPFFKSARIRGALDTIAEKFHAYGPLVLATNRFVPAFRSLAFVAAGLARMRVASVLLYGTASAAVWNAMLLAIGYAAGKNWERIKALAPGVIMAAAIVALVVVAVGHFVIRRRQRR